jgi:hypothetical protein
MAIDSFTTVHENIYSTTTELVLPQEWGQRSRELAAVWNVISPLDITVNLQETKGPENLLKDSLRMQTEVRLWGTQ